MLRPQLTVVNSAMQIHALCGQWGLLSPLEQNQASAQEGAETAPQSTVKYFVVPENDIAGVLVMYHSGLRLVYGRARTRRAIGQLRRELKRVAQQQLISLEAFGPEPKQHQSRLPLD